MALSTNRMTSIYETYAAKICRHVGLPQGSYDAQELNSYIMALPLGEAHAALGNVELENLPRLGDTVSLNDHMQAHFFSLLLNPARDLIEFTKPVLIKRQHLERLEGWRDWRTLTVYLHQEGMEPAAVFRNTPIPIKAGPFETVDYYAADIRVVLGRSVPFAWGG
jgi:hypothetical protein